MHTSTPAHQHTSTPAHIHRDAHALLDSLVAGDIEVQGALGDALLAERAPGHVVGRVRVKVHPAQNRVDI